MDMNELEQQMIEEIDDLGDMTITFNAVELSSVMTGLISLIVEAPDDERKHPMLLGAKAAARKIVAVVDKGPSPYNHLFEED